MLRHLETVPGPASTRAATTTEPKTFTAQEIADAIAELEKEQRHQSLGQDGVAQIASVLEQLHLDLPADAVTTQIEAKRLLLLQAKRKRHRTAIASVAAICCCICIAIFLGMGSQAPPALVETITVPVAAPVAAEEGIARQVVPSQFLVDVQEADGTWITKTLGEVPDGVRVQLPADDLVHLMKLGPQAKANTFVHDYTWQMFRKNGEWYLRGYTGTPRSRSALLAEPIPIHNQKDPVGMYYSTPVIVPLKSVVVENSEVVYEQEQKMDLRVIDVDKVIFGK